MKSKGNIVFLGMMGSGKTTVGKLVSRKLKQEFFDTDHEIENKFKMKIKEIFSKKGETFFRNYEEKLTLEILKKKNVVISLGGGTFLNKYVQKEILSNHLSFWLNWDDKILIERIKGSSKRPIAFKASKNELSNLIKKRSNIYSKALYKLNCESFTKDDIVKNIVDIYEAN
tara:strand:- start:124 stop:636 length:513 start_codon:yes stop_codon:yes gene_type:complete